MGPMGRMGPMGPWDPWAPWAPWAHIGPFGPYIQAFSVLGHLLAAIFKILTLYFGHVSIDFGYVCIPQFLGPMGSMGRDSFEFAALRARNQIYLDCLHELNAQPHMLAT